MKFFQITVPEGVIYQNFTLEPENDPNFEDPEIEFIHRNHEQLTTLLHQVAEKYPQITKLTSIGKSIQNRELWVMEISDNPGIKEVLEPEVKIISNMHGNEVKGRVLSIAMIQHLTQNYEKEERITEIVNNHRIFIMPRLVFTRFIFHNSIFVNPYAAEN